MNRTFIVEDYAEDDFGQWAKDEVTGEQGYIDDERSCFWTWDDTECARQSRPFKGCALTSQIKAQARIFPEHGSKGKDQKRKGKERTYPQSGLSASGTLNEERYGHAWESDDWSASHWSDESWTSAAGWFCTEAHSAWMVATPLNLANQPTHVVLGLGCTRSIGSRAAIERFKKHAWYYGVTTEFCR